MEDSLLNIMAHMFNLNNRSDFEFKMRHFFGVYRLFFFSTMHFESLTLVMRMKIYENLNNKFEKAGTSAQLLNSIGSGVIAQYASTPFFKLNVANHHSELGSNTLKKFLRSARTDQAKLEFYFKVHPLVLARVGIIGFFHLFLGNKILH